MRKCDHPNIIKYLETYQEGNALKMVMEMSPLGTLDSYIRKLKGLPMEKRAAKALYECVLAMEHCFQIGILHRDIKPDNIMIGTDGEAKLIDFGVSLTDFY